MNVKRLVRLAKPYRGAGVVFTAPDAGGRIRVLLGRRMFRPYAGYWSLPGGGMEDRDNGSFRACAAREAFEETVGIPKLNDIQRVFLERLTTAPEHRVRLRPVFDYRSYLLPLRTIPDLRLWPNTKSWGNEFRQFDWFRTDDLPDPLHPHLAKTLKCLLGGA